MVDIIGLSIKLKQAKDAINNSNLGSPDKAKAKQAQELGPAVKELQARVEILEALMSQLMGISPEKMTEIIDEQVSKMVVTKTTDTLALETVPCTECGRPIHKSLKACQVCGTARPTK